MKSACYDKAGTCNDLKCFLYIQLIDMLGYFPQVIAWNPIQNMVNRFMISFICTKSHQCDMVATLREINRNILYFFIVDRIIRSQVFSDRWFDHRDDDMIFLLW